MEINLTPSEALAYSTIRIECTNSIGQISTGTGFFFNLLDDPQNNSSVPVIITNKHVISGAKSGKLIFTLSSNEGKAIDNQHYFFNITEFEEGWRFHPDHNVDLCAYPMAGILNHLKQQNKIPFFIPFTKSLIPSKEQLENLNPLEDVVMIGYPNGIWDNINNQPILRRGITATHPNKDYCGKKEFMADIASFPGSSGSPVLIFNENGYSDRSGTYLGGKRILLLGILYAGPQHTATGELIIANIPTTQVPIPISRIPNNLGLIIKSERILELEELFK